MAVEELLFWFVGIPALAYVVAVVWLRWTMKRIAERQLGFLREGTTSRFLVYASLLSTPILFGLVMLQLALGTPENPSVDPVVRYLGMTFATAAGLTVLSEAWIVVRRKAVAYREHFARVLNMTVLPETVVLFTLVIELQVVTYIRTSSLPLQPTVSEALLRTLQYTMVGAVSAPLEAFLAGRVANLDGRGFIRALLMMIPGEVPALLTLVLATLQLGAL